MRLQGKIALVTGAGNGIGQGIALAFARAGAIVIGCDLDPAAVRATADRLAGEGLTLDVRGGVDLTDAAQVSALADAVGATYGRLDILVNAAAFAVFGWIDEISPADWRRTLVGELDIVFLLTQATWPLMKASGKAAIVNFASANARHALEGSAALAHCAGKGGILAMTRQLAMEGAPHGIRANTISPGFILTAATGAHMAAVSDLRDRVLAKNMLKILGEPADVAWLALFLASDEARYVTGADYPIDAGATAW